MKSLLVLIIALPLWSQVPAVPNSDFPTFRTNLNASLAKAANITTSYTNPSWITSLAYVKITGVPTFVPAGGTAGQILSKINSTDYNTEWVNPSSVAGPTGPTGPTGASGTNGPTGPTGPTGASGAGNGNNTYCADATGSSTTYTCPTPSPTVSTLTGLLVTFKPQTTNGSTPTLNVGGLGAKNLKQADCSTAVTAASLVGGSTYLFSYDGTSFCQSAGAGGGGAASGVMDLTVSFDGGGIPLTGPTSRCRTVSAAGTISGVYVIGDQTGTVTVDVSKVAFSSYTGPGAASSITASAIPAISSGARYSDTTLTGWTTSVSAADVVCFTLSSPVTVQWVQATLKVR